VHLLSQHALASLKFAFELSFFESNTEKGDRKTGEDRE
jgi:hypothetical protein